MQKQSQVQLDCHSQLETNRSRSLAGELLRIGLPVVLMSEKS